MMLLLGVVFIALIAGSIQSISADHLEPGIGIFSDRTTVELSTPKDSNYKIYLQSVIRNEGGQLINVAESMANSYVAHELTDHVFDTLMGEKEIVTVDGIKYEKVQYTYTPSIEYRFLGLYPIFSEKNLEITSTEDQRTKMQKNKDYALWNVHYCADFKEDHGYQCIPIFQALVPNMTLEHTDTVTHQWTILRAMN